jgi:lipoxygenase homology domain-containing protein 1
MIISQIELLPVQRDDTSTQHEYHVTVRTADIRFAGTDADVFIEISGQDASASWHSTDRHLLATSQNNFERNSEDHFTIVYGPFVL